MGAPTSSILSDIYLQYFENTIIFDILTQHKIAGYFRYVDDILVIYNETLKNIHTVLDVFNELSPTLTFTLETETDTNINLLDISIFTTNDSVQFKIYRKPTATDTLIPSDSNHPMAHKLSAIHYLANRLLTYPMTDKNKLHE